MNTNYKIFAIILGTLVIGILLGAAGHAALMSAHNKTYDRVPPSEYFLTHIDRVLQPDSSQRSQVDLIAHRTASRITALFDQHRMEMSMLLDSMNEALEPILRPDQQKRLAHEIALPNEEEGEESSLGSMISFSYEYGEHLQQQLDLDSLQTERVMAIIRLSHLKFRKNVEAAAGDAKKLEWSEHALFDETSRNIQDVLTIEQREVFHRKQAEIRKYSEEELKEEE